MVKSLSNISLTDFRKFLEFKELNLIRNSGGHEVWSHRNLLRPVILQSHIDLVPEFIVRNSLRTIGSSRSELESFLNR